jgi:hypothetical protein
MSGVLRKSKQITPRVPLTLKDSIGRVFSVDLLIFAKTLDSLHQLSMITDGGAKRATPRDDAPVDAKPSL